MKTLTLVEWVHAIDQGIPLQCRPAEPSGLQWFDAHNRQNQFLVAAYRQYEWRVKPEYVQINFLSVLAPDKMIGEYESRFTFTLKNGGKVYSCCRDSDEYPIAWKSFDAAQQALDAVLVALGVKSIV